MVFKTIAKSCFLELCRLFKKQFCNTNAAILQQKPARFATRSGLFCNTNAAILQQKPARFAPTNLLKPARFATRTGLLCNMNAAILQQRPVSSSMHTGIQRHTQLLEGYLATNTRPFVTEVVRFATLGGLFGVTICSDFEGSKAPKRANKRAVCN